MQSPQTSQIVSEIFIIGCSPIHSLECKGQKIPLKKAPLHLFKVKTTRASNMSHHWSYLKTEYEQSKGMQRSCWVPILQHNRHLHHRIKPCSQESMWAWPSALLLTCFSSHNPHASVPGTILARDLLIQTEWAGRWFAVGRVGKSKRKEKGLPIAYDFQFAKR